MHDSDSKIEIRSKVTWHVQSTIVDLSASLSELSAVKIVDRRSYRSVSIYFPTCLDQNHFIYLNQEVAENIAKVNSICIQNSSLGRVFFYFYFTLPGDTIAINMSSELINLVSSVRATLSCEIVRNEQG